ncbi:MAG TPA: phosphate acyltransferase, partial [Phycisphaerales bacterium]|nr:phosphate acyltransferase [Phycisphaerales bacterium]
NFIGNVEGRDLFNGSCDVMICDGFVGNVVLKLIEGMAQSVIKGLLHEVATKMPAAAKMVEMGARSLAERWDFNEYGGAPLLGVNGICIICHGASSDVGIKNAVRSAKNFAATRVNEQITNLLSQASEVADG